MLRFSTSVSLMFRELPLAERFAAAARAGFQAVEIQVLMEGRPADIAAAARDAGVGVALVNVGMGDFLGGGAGLSGVPGREQVFQEELLQTLETASLLGCTQVHIGPSRIPEGVARQACLDRYIANVQMALPLAEQAGIRLLLEPLNRVEGPSVLLTDLEEAVALIEGPFAGRVGLQFDLYHMVLNQVDVPAAFRRHFHHIAHIQFADAPGRRQPGTGSIDFPGLFGMIADSPYAGWTGAEYFPAQPTADTFAWLESWHGRPA